MDFRKILVIDIETVPQYIGYDHLPDDVRQFWDIKAQQLTQGNSLAEEVYNRAGIYAEFGKIICISLGFFSVDEHGVPNQFKVTSFFGHDEKEILFDFFKLFNDNKLPGFKIAGHNVKEFDVPYISRRALINDLKIPEQIDYSSKKPWEVDMIDTLQLWKFGDMKSYISLNLMSNILGVPSPKDDIDGSQVFNVYYNENGGLERIKTYCEKDVITVANLLLRLKQMPIMSEEQIIYV